HVTPEAGVIASNARATAFLDCTFDARQKRYRAVLPAQLLSAEREPLEASASPWWRPLREGVAPPTTTVGLKRPDGTLAWALISVALAPSGGGRQKSLLVTFIDVTSTKEASDAL